MNPEHRREPSLPFAFRQEAPERGASLPISARSPIGLLGLQMTAERTALGRRDVSLKLMRTRERQARQGV